MVTVTILPERTIRQVEPGTVAQTLRRLGLHQDAHLVVRGEDILTGDTRLQEEDQVDVLPVISGGAASPLASEPLVGQGRSSPPARRPLVGQRPLSGRQGPEGA
ncbi:MAG: MoaD/ThiS family protein [Candidatus Dormibacteraceae bacterium]